MNDESPRRIYVSYNHAKNAEGAHREAAEELARQMAWIGENYGEMIQGRLEKGYAFVFADQEHYASEAA